MGDMKTPDFDDLLAAFDIPDIDAKEAIQSRSDQDQVQDQVQVGGDAGDVRETGSPSSHGERPAVSVIVKNMVRSESMEDGEGMESTHSPEVAADPPGHLTSPLSPDLTEPQISNGFEGSVAVDHHHHHQGSEPWSLRSPLGGDDDGGGDKVAEVGLIQHTTDVMNSLKPLLFPSSPHLSPPPLPPLPPPQEDNRHLLVTSPPPLLTQNGSVKTQMNSDDDDDSEPDLGSPLVIQESPVSPVPPPPLPPPPPPPRLTPQSPEPTSCDVSRPPRLSLPPPLPAAKPEPPSDDGDQLPPLPGPPRLDEAPPTSSTSEEEKYPEHVIDERDSPESPPPSETGQLVPELTTTSDPNHDEMMDAEPSSEGRQGDGEEMADDVKENGGGGSSVSETDSSALRPLKVKIKMSTGSITRTVAPKRNVKASSRLADGSRPSPESHNTKTTKMAATPAEVKQKTTTDVKPKVSATAVSITKTAALPSVCTSSSRGGGINLRSLGQKTLHSGVMLPAAAPQTNRPASIVNSSGAIISKTQTNLVETFNKILNNKNLLPSYKPDLSAALTKEWGIPLPAQGYRCLECGDAFALEQSLARHYDRRSLRIEVTCNHCAKRLAFFNKCSLLLHAREHKERGLIMQCSHLVMKPVPVEQMIGQHEPTTMTTTSGPSSSSSSSRKSDEVHHLSNKCPECSTQFSSREEVADHFQEVRASQSTPCTECTPPMMLPNSCSAAAHQRLHQGCSAPHVCPECGGSAKQPPLLQTHLDETCLHFARRIGYRCSSCQVVFGGLNSVKSHIQQAHCDMFHKCPSCPMAFKSAPSIQSHIAAQHPATPEGQAMLIYKCVMCDTVFTNKAQLHVHFDSHLTNQKVHVFKCPECTKLFSQKNSLLDHFKTHKTPAVIKRELPSSPAVSSRSRPAVKVETSSGSDGWSREKEEKVKTPSGWKCAPCHARYTEREDYIKHMSEQHGKVLKKFPCNKCESSFTTTSSLRRHIRDKHKVVTRGFRCHLCTESKKTFSSRSMLERHVQLRHSVDSVSQDTMMGGADEADSSSEQDGAVASRRRRRGVVKTEQEDESTDGTSPVKKARSSSSVSDSGFRCAPCGFTSSEQTSFLDHIAQHRRGGGADGGLQCLHCGACFTSNSSLSRHRFITHKVRDALGDTHQTAAAALPAPSPGNGDLDSSSPSSPSSQTAVATRGKDDEDALTCRVCGKQFEKATDLNTHFRTHGMAFINARNTTKTTP